MKNTTLCYIEKDGQYLMLHRIKKKNDCNSHKWIGVGGKFQEKESPQECVIRETLEETGLTLSEPVYRGIVTFVSDEWETEQMHLFTCTEFEGTLIESDSCDEGILEWVKKEDVTKLPVWEGDKLFLALLSRDVPFFSMKLEYCADTLIFASLNGRELSKNENRYII